MFDRVVDAVAELGFSDIVSSPKQGRFTYRPPHPRPSFDSHGAPSVGANLGWSGIDGACLNLPSLRRRHDGRQNEQQSAKTTLFLRDEIATVEKKIRAFRRQTNGGAVVLVATLISTLLTST